MNPSRRFNIASRRQSNNSPDINKPRHQTDSWPTHRSRISLSSKLLTLFFNINLDVADPRRRTSRGIRPQQIWAVDLGQRWYHLHKWWVTHGYFISRSQKLTAAPPFVERTTGSVRIGGVSVLPQARFCVLKVSGSRRIDSFWRRVFTQTSNVSSKKELQPAVGEKKPRKMSSFL